MVLSVHVMFSFILVSGYLLRRKSFDNCVGTKILLEQNCQAPKLRLISRTNTPLGLYFIVYYRTHQKQILERINHKMNRQKYLTKFTF